MFNVEHFIVKTNHLCVRKAVVIYSVRATRYTQNRIEGSDVLKVAC